MDFSSYYFFPFTDPNFGQSSIICDKKLFDRLYEDDIPPSSHKEEDILLGIELKDKLKEHGLYYSYNCLYISEYSSISQLINLLKDLKFEFNEWIGHPEYFDFLLETQLQVEKVKNKLDFISKWFYISIVESQVGPIINVALKPIWQVSKSLSGVSSEILTKQFKKIGIVEVSPETYKYNKEISKEELEKILSKYSFDSNNEFTLLTNGQLDD